jgi:hypothetical protein
MCRIFKNGRVEGVWCANSVLGPPWTARLCAWCLQLPGLEVCMASACRDVQEDEEDEDWHISWYGKDKGTNQARTGGWDEDAKHADAKVVLSPMSNRASPSPATLKSSCASAVVGTFLGSSFVKPETEHRSCLLALQMFCNHLYMCADSWHYYI